MLDLWYRSEGGDLDGFVWIWLDWDLLGEDGRIGEGILLFFVVYVILVDLFAGLWYRLLYCFIDFI